MLKIRLIRTKVHTFTKKLIAYWQIIVIGLKDKIVKLDFCRIMINYLFRIQNDEVLHILEVFIKSFHELIIISCKNEAIEINYIKGKRKK